MGGLSFFGRNADEVHSRWQALTSEDVTALEDVVFNTHTLANYVDDAISLIFICTNHLELKGLGNKFNEMYNAVL